MKLYHRTSHADKILAEGFKDHTGFYLTATKTTGVWFSNIPLDSNEGAKGDVLLMLKIPIKEIREYEWIEEGKPYREFQIPASLANKYGPPVIIEDRSKEP